MKKDIVDMNDASLEKSKNRFRTLYENASMGYQSLGEDGHLIEANQTWLRLMGYSEYMDETKATSMGIKTLLEKPLALKHLAKTVRKVLDSAKQTEITEV